MKPKAHILTSMFAAIVCVLVVITAFASHGNEGTQVDAANTPLVQRVSVKLQWQEDDSYTIPPVILTQMVPVTEERAGTRNVCKTIVDYKEEVVDVDVNGVTEQQVRKVPIKREITVEEPYTYTVTVSKPENREITFPPDTMLMEGTRNGGLRPMSLERLRFKKDQELTGFIVNDYRDAVAADGMLRRLFGPVSNHDPRIYFVRNESLKAPGRNWLLPTSETEWINSRPFMEGAFEKRTAILWFFDINDENAAERWKEFNYAHVKLGRKPMVFLAVATGQESPAVHVYAKQHKATPAIIVDEDGNLAKAAGIDLQKRPDLQFSLMDEDSAFHVVKSRTLTGCIEEAMAMLRRTEAQSP